MLLGRYTQQPGERIKRELDYTQFLEDAETITGIAATIDPEEGDDIAVPFEIEVVVDPDGKVFAYFAAGGVDGVDYTVQFAVTTSAGQILNDEVEFDVEEI